MQKDYQAWGGGGWGWVSGCVIKIAQVRLGNISHWIERTGMDSRSI